MWVASSKVVGSRGAGAIGLISKCSLTKMSTFHLQPTSLLLFISTLGLSPTCAKGVCGYNDDCQSTKMLK